MAKPSTDTKEHTFETAILRLEQIVQAMDEEELPLDQLIVRFEEGTQLLQVAT